MLLRTLISHTGKCLAAATMMFVAQPAAQADVFDAFDSLQPVNTYFGECCGDLDLGGDTCCTGTCCETCCVCPPAPTMIGDLSLGIPQALNNGPGTNFTPNFYSRVADNNSAIPQDRVYMNYKFINDYRAYKDIGANAADYNTDLQYYELGLEKTFADGNLSAELILPFSYAPQSTITAGSTSPASNQYELQNIAFGLKALLVETDTSAFSAGLRVEAPTREPVEIPAAGIKWSRDAWTFTPYMAALLTPTDDTFIQSFVAYRMQSDDQFVTGVGPVREPNYFYADAQLGRWLHRNHGCEGLTGLQAKVELHYTASFEPYEPRGVLLNSVSGEHDSLNLTAGLTALFNDNATVTTAFVLPIRDGSNFSPLGALSSFPSDRQVDWSFIAQFNYYFGN